MRRIVLLLTLHLGAVAGAQMLGAQLQLSSTTIRPGETVVGTLSLTNSNSNPTMYLDALEYPALSESFVIDDNDFFLNAPVALLSGETWTGPSFRLQLAPTFAPGSYSQAVNVLGGPSAGSQAVIGTTSFSIQAVPEPASIVGLSVFAMAALRCRRRIR